MIFYMGGKKQKRLFLHKKWGKRAFLCRKQSPKVHVFGRKKKGKMGNEGRLILVQKFKLLLVLYTKNWFPGVSLVIFHSLEGKNHLFEPLWLPLSRRLLYPRRLKSFFEYFHPIPPKN